MTNELNPVVTTCESRLVTLKNLFAHYYLDIVAVESGAKIPGSFWGEPEAGLIGNRLYIRDDTPLHSAFHEACHYICMDQSRRANLDTDAGGSVAEENGVCYLQILLADHLPGFNRDIMMKDMDRWGYSFRLGSSRAWFEHDAEDARQWLLQAGIIDMDNSPTWTLLQNIAS